MDYLICVYSLYLFLSDIYESDLSLSFFSLFFLVSFALAGLCSRGEKKEI